MEEWDAGVMNDVMTRVARGIIGRPVKFEFDGSFARWNTEPMRIDPEIARAFGLPREITEAEMIVSNTRTGVKCWVCGAKIDIGSLRFHLSHMVPVPVVCSCGLFVTEFWQDPVTDPPTPCPELRCRVGYVRGSGTLGGPLPDWWHDAVDEATRLLRDDRAEAKLGRLMMSAFADTRDGTHLAMFADWLEENEYPLNAGAIREEITNRE